MEIKIVDMDYIQENDGMYLRGEWDFDEYIEFWIPNEEEIVKVPTIDYLREKVFELQKLTFAH